VHGLLGRLLQEFVDRRLEGSLWKVVSNHDGDFLDELALGVSGCREQSAGRAVAGHVFVEPDLDHPGLIEEDQILGDQEPPEAVPAEDTPEPI
jgi:hypothetical protein